MRLICFSHLQRNPIGLLERFLGCLGIEYRGSNPPNQHLKGSCEPPSTRLTWHRQQSLIHLFLAVSKLLCQWVFNLFVMRIVLVFLFILFLGIDL